MSQRALLIWTRSRADWPEDQKLLTARDYDVLHLPCISVAPVDFTMLKTSDPTAIVFTSRHAVTALASANDPKLLNLPAYTFGERTLAAMTAAGFVNGNRLEANNAAAMVPLLASKLTSADRVLWPTGDEVAYPINTALSDVGISCERMIVYRTTSALTDSSGGEPTSQTLQRVLSSECGWIAFASPTAVKAFVACFANDLPHISNHYAARCLGTTTAAMAKTYFSHVWNAPVPELQALVP